MHQLQTYTQYQLSIIHTSVNPVHNAPVEQKKEEKDRAV